MFVPGLAAQFEPVPVEVQAGWSLIDGLWTAPPPAPEPLTDWPDVIAARRYEAEVAGIVWQGHGIATDRDSQQKMSDERNAVKDGLRTGGKGWKCLDLATGTVVFRPTTNEEILELTAAAYRHVSDCFDREGQLLAALADGTITLASLDEGWPV